MQESPEVKNKGLKYIPPKWSLHLNTHMSFNQQTLLNSFHSMHLNWGVKSFTLNNEETLGSASYTCSNTYPPLSHEVAITL